MMRKREGASVPAPESVKTRPEKRRSEDHERSHRPHWREPRKHLRHFRHRRAPARTPDPLSHGDVGALLLLRAAPSARPLHVGGASEGRLRFRPRRGVGHRRHLRRERLPRVAAGRMGGRPAARTPTRDTLRRCLHLGGTHLDRTLRICREQAALLPRARSDSLRDGAAQAEHLRNRRRPLPGGRRATRRGLLDLLHGHQPRLVPRPARHGLPRRDYRLALGLRRGGRGHAGGSRHLSRGRA